MIRKITNGEEIRKMPLKNKFDLLLASVKVVRESQINFRKSESHDDMKRCVYAEKNLDMLLKFLTVSDEKNKTSETTRRA